MLNNTSDWSSEGRERDKFQICEVMLHSRDPFDLNSV